MTDKQRIKRVEQRISSLAQTIAAFAPTQPDTHPPVTLSEALKHQPLGLRRFENMAEAKAASHRVKEKQGIKPLKPAFNFAMQQQIHEWIHKRRDGPNPKHNITVMPVTPRNRSRTPNGTTTESEVTPERRHRDLNAPTSGAKQRTTA